MTRPTTPIVALDVPSIERARPLVRTLGDACQWYKVGLELFVAEGPHVVTWLRELGKDVFLDLKLHDIPNTVRGAARAAAAHGARLVTVQGSGGAAMIAAAIEGAGAQDGTGCGVLVVTVLTSLTATDVATAWGRTGVIVADEVQRIAHMAGTTGAHGVVCSGHEAAAVHAALPALEVLVPGVRSAGGASHDQARVVTPADAARAGAIYVEIVRMVTSADDPVAAYERAVLDLSA